MKNIPGKLYRRIEIMLEAGKRERDIVTLIPNVSVSQVEYVRRTRGNATPETKRKLSPDPVRTLHDAGKLNDMNLIAAQNIERAWRISAMEVGLKCASVEMKIDNIGRKSVSECPAEIRLVHQFNQWRHECVNKRIKVNPIIHVLTEPLSLYQVDRYYGQTNGLTSKLLVAGLKLYSEMFGY